MTPNLVVAYVADAPASAALYRRLFCTEPVESSPNWAMFALPGGIALGLWNRAEVAPRATLPGGIELAFPVDSEAALADTRAAWEALGLRIIQEPVRMDFGLTFTAADPDGHRLRIIAPAQ